MAEINITENYHRMMHLHGRKMITTSEVKITQANVVDVLKKTLYTHNANRAEIDYLYKYYKGDQPILYRTKEVRPEICNTVVENRANEIVSFKVGYLCGEPIQYVSRGGEDSITEAINRLNEYMFAEDKSSQDQELIEWQMICGTAYRMVLPDSEFTDEEPDESPFELFTLDPRNTYIVYSADVRHKPMMAVNYYKDDDGVIHYSVFTDTYFFGIDNTMVNIQKSRPHAYGAIPIIEYPANNARLGSFEIAIPLLDTINLIDSNSMDGIEQIIQSFIKFINCDISMQEYEDFLAMGAIKVNSQDGKNADVDIVTTELNQTQTHTFKDDIYKSVLTICGMPNRNGGSSTSDTGTAVWLRDGFSEAEQRAKDSENVFKKAEKKVLKLILRYCRDLTDLDLKLSDIDIRFTRRNYDNIQSKSQVLISLLNCEKVHPQLAYQMCGAFPDSESAYTMSMKYYEEQMAKWNPVEIDEGEEDAEEARGTVQTD